MLERARSTFRLKPKERCPGEVICTDDPINGVISRMNGETLETYCKPERCRFYWTKEGTTPPEYAGMFEAAMMLREARLGELRQGFNYYERTLPGWAIEAYKAAERAFRTAENEINAETTEEREERENGGRKFADGGDSDAFAQIEAQIAAAREASETRDDWEKMLDAHPHIPGQIIGYMRENTR
jgi:hypothetical protein